jgi:co-chaperonin GroES (HSP10)
MNLEPANRHILVKPIPEEAKEETSSSIMLPDDYKKTESPYLTCSVLAVAHDSKLIDIVANSDIILVERRMLQKIEMKGREFYLVLDNYVMGRLTK